MQGILELANIRLIMVSFLSIVIDNFFQRKCRERDYLPYFLIFDALLNF